MGIARHVYDGAANNWICLTCGRCTDDCECEDPGDGIATGVMPGTGLRYATLEPYRVVAYAEGGYCQQKAAPEGWRLLRACEEMPADVERALCAALGIACKV
jgi:hypothetical protein